MNIARKVLPILIAGALCAASHALAGGVAPPAPPIDFSNFHTPDQINTELDNLQAAHPGLAQTFSIGTSVEGRAIRGIKISDNVAVDEADEGDVIVVALHHAREWMTPEMALYLAEYLLTHYNTDAALRQCMDNLEIWIIPVLNPDGYVYTASAPANRYWRKNRSFNADGTRGVDLNRNYAYQWGGGAGGAEGSPNPWEDTYRGPSAFSEPETTAFRNFVQSLHHPRALLSYHSFGEMFLRPWAYTIADPPGEPTLAFLAQNSIARIAAVHGHTYVETISYNSFGEATDYFWNEMRLAGFTPEVRPPWGSAGLTGFAPSPSEILPSNEENLAAALALIRDAGCRRLWIKDSAADTGAEPSPVPYWTSPDIWTTPATLVEGSVVTLNVRVRNDGPGAKPGSVVRAYYTDPRVALEFPNPANVLIGEQTLNLPPGDTTVSFSWTVPTGTNIWGERHWCVGAIVTHADDRPLTTIIPRTNNLGARNFETTTMTAAGATLFVASTNFLDVAAEHGVKVDPRALPPGWEVVVPPLPPRKRVNRKARLLGVTAPVLEPGETLIQPVRIRPPRDAKVGATYDIHVRGYLSPLVPGKRREMGNGYTFQVRIVPEPPPATSDR